jgi:signal transduction histidine kinase
MATRLLRLPLLAKILLSTTVAITVLFALTGEIVLHHIGRTMSEILAAEVQSSFRAYTALLSSRADLLSSVSRILSTMREVRLAFSTGDRATIQDTAGELWSKISNSGAFFLVTDPRGRVLASLGGVTSLPLEENLVVVPQAASRFPQQVSGFHLWNGNLYYLTVTPVYVDSTQGPALLNVLVAGYHVDALVAQKLKENTDSEFLFLTPQGVMASTLNPRATAAIVQSLQRNRFAERVSDGVAEYARFETQLADLTGKPIGEICILRSFEGARKRINSLYTNILLLWLAAIGIGFCVTYLLARRIVEPVKRLDRAAAEVARRNYAIEVPVTSEDELGRLARTFNNMCASIRQAREDLIRNERISTIGRLSASIVHDLRNPLAAIYGGAEMLVDADLPPANVKRLAGNIYRASRRIQEMLQDLLDVSRGKERPAEPCRLREVASAACENLEPAARQQGVEIALEIPSDLELPLERSRMERVFVNLIANSLEAMPKGGRIRLSASLQAGSAVVEVEDNGPGIEPAIRSQLFQPFVSGKRNGLGLGLALSRQTIVDHGGEIWVESEPGRGARFLFRLPGAQSRAATPADSSVLPS